MTQSFHAIEYQRRNGVAVIIMNNPPVNGLSHAVRRGLVEAFAQAVDDPHVCAVVLTGAGKGFSAGGDIRELGTPAAAAAPALSLQVHPVIESCCKPTVAALHGIAMGGGLETALVCHYRLAAADTRIALPEIRLGLIPLSGTQRLPRVLGLGAAIDLILESKTMRARDFPPNTLFDEVIDAEPAAVVERAIEYASAITRDRREPLPLVRHRPLKAAEDSGVVLSQARQRAAEIGPVATAAVEAIAGALESADFDAGMKRARELYDALSASHEVRRQRDQFLAARSGTGAASSPGGPASPGRERRSREPPP
ncbi:MAG: enoyl-CoA hydratase/isomerase family protein [Steroidobacteraceae bacterium]